MRGGGDFSATDVSPLRMSGSSSKLLVSGFLTNQSEPSDKLDKVALGCSNLSLLISSEQANTKYS
jgi:hypothetical protein